MQQTLRQSATATTSRRALVLGIGNTLLQDDGAGVHALRLLRQQCRLPGVDFLDGGTLSFTLAREIEQHDTLLVLDAAELGLPPGTVRVFEDERMDAFLGSARKRSVHEVGLLDLLAVVALTDRMPSRRALIGVQPASLGWDEQPSPPVALALPDMVSRALALLTPWTAAEASHE